MEFLERCGVAGFVLLIFAAALWALQQRGIVRLPRPSPRAERRLQIIERLQLTPQHSLCLIRLENRVLLIGTAPTNCQLLDEADL